MSGKDLNYQIVYRGRQLVHFVPGCWTFFQRPKEAGGGFWLGRTYDDCFWLEFPHPVSLHTGISYIVSADSIAGCYRDFDDDFELTP